MANLVEEKFKYIKDNHKVILDKLYYGKIFTVKIDDFDLSNGDKILITEGCDDYYETYLSKSECLQLSSFFNELSSIAPEESFEGTLR